MLASRIPAAKGSILEFCGRTPSAERGAAKRSTGALDVASRRQKKERPRYRAQL